MRAAGVGLQVGVDGELRAAITAEDSLVVPFGRGPWFNGMARQGVVAVLASVEVAAAFHFDGDDVERGVVVEAASLGIEVETADVWGLRSHEGVRIAGGERAEPQERQDLRQGGV